ncbi:amidohydrolase family-domain-containing protein [Pisolithus croceorrhizus]|nr:amidohydrolase family-domain-containing protein [Pisolithus croceorrhizus]
MGHLSPTGYWGNKLPRLVDYGIGGRLNLRSIKLFVDVCIYFACIFFTGHVCLHIYSDDPATSGIMRIREDVPSDLVKRFHADDWQVASTNACRLYVPLRTPCLIYIHCTGDRTSRAVLDILEDVFAGTNLWEARPRIEHAQVMTSEDLERMGWLGAIPNVQPTHAVSGGCDLLWGPERIRGAYAYRTMIQTSRNQILPLGSDFPVEGINPLLGFYAAVTRLSASGQFPHGPQGCYLEQRSTRFHALQGMTLGAAYASFSESVTGSLAMGKRADFVVLDRDITTVPEPEILVTKVLATFIDGEVVYKSL